MKKAIIFLLLTATLVLSSCAEGITGATDQPSGGGKTSDVTTSQTAPTADARTDDVPVVLPDVARISDGGRITGKMPGTAEYKNKMGELYYGFDIRTVVEAEVIAVQPDKYYVPSSDVTYYVAKLRILDAIRGENLPEEIYLRYAYTEWNVIGGYDSLILSIRQIGLENYLLINDTEGSYAYFPNMFEAASGRIDTGSAIGFKDGAVSDIDYGFCYAAEPGENVETVKERILSAAQGQTEDQRYNDYYTFLPCDYLTAADLLTTEEAVQAYSEVRPGGENAYMQELSIDGAALTGLITISATYTRVVNGFATDETVSFNKIREADPLVTRSKARYDETDLASVPDIAAALGQIDLAEVTLSDKEESTRQYYRGSWQCRVVGCVRKTDAGVYGILCVKWDGSGGCEVQYESRYILYGPDGKGSVVTAIEIAQLFGSGSIPRSI